MRIALNCIGYLPGCGGVETYLCSLLEALQRTDRENNYLVLCDEPAAAALPIKADNFRLHCLDYHKNSLKGLLRGAVKRFTNRDILCRELNGLAVDVMHHPLTILNPPDLPYPSVLTFHDMQQEFFPAFFSAAELRQRRKTYRPSAEQATAIIALSQHTRHCLIERYAIDPAKVQVVYSGCSPHFRPRSPAEVAETGRRLRLERPFMFYPAATWPHKNHRRLLEAVRIMRDCSNFTGELILTGSPMEAQWELLDAVDRLGLGATVRWLGHLPHETLPYLYNLARLMVFPSLFEGFGLPVLEAMASACPVVCSNSSSLPEVGGEAALYFDPLNSAEIAIKLAHAWNDDHLLEQLRQRGLAQAARFGWDQTARQTIEVYRSVVARQ